MKFILKKTLLRKSLFLFTKGFIVGVLLVSQFFPTPVFASDSTQSWNFSSAGDYTPSDSTLIEVDSNSARLKVRNYSSDANTAALFHFDESSGNPADSSSNSNSASASEVTYSAGSLNNAATLNGTSSKVTVTDSASLSLSQANTLEAWTKLSESISEGSHAQRQGVLDKGDYQLYFDNETGKLTYELADSTKTTWSQVAGIDINNSWDLDGQLALHATVAVGSDLYVALGNAVGDAEVWRRSAGEWAKVGGDGLNSGWLSGQFESTATLDTDGTDVYAGLGTTAGDAEVWKYTVSTGLWSRIGGDAINSSWAVSTFETVRGIEYAGGVLYVGLGDSANDAEVWSWNGTTWTKIGGDSLNSGWTTNFEYVYTLHHDGTYLYAGLGATAGDAEVWRWNGSAWTKIGGDAVNTSWADATYEVVTSLTSAGGSLYAGLGTTANDAEVWRFTSGSWTQVGGDSLNSGWTTNYEAVYSLTTDGTNVYAGLGATAGDNEVWSWNGSVWTKIGGDTINNSFTNTHTIVESLFYSGSTLYAGIISGSAIRTAELWSYSGGSWTQLGGDYINGSWGFRGLQSVETMTVSGSKLYAGTGTTGAGNALVWEFDGSSWTLVGGQGINSSWAANTYENVISMVSYQGDLYAGLGVTANDAEVWRYSEGSWTQIGGDSLNSGWTTNYEEVLALANLDGYMYAAIGSSANDAEVWRWNGSAWTKIGGDSTNSGWTTNFDRVTSLGVYSGELYAGLGSTAGEAEVWKWNGSAWSKVGGDTVNSSWNSTDYEQVDSMIAFNNKLYAGLGTGTGEAEVWEYDGSSWTQIGGDDIGSSWTTGTYERVRSLVGYNGELYAGIGNTAGDGEVWKWNGTTWTQVAGDSLNSSWTNVIEEVMSFSVYKGKLYAGIGNTQNVDASIWAYGGNGYLQSTTATFNTDWRHVAATYDGTNMKLYINGVLDNSVAVSLSMPDSSRSLLIGTTYAGREAGKSQGHFDGMLDEIRISSTARSSFISAPYATTAQTVQPTTAVYTSGVNNFDAFTVSETLNGGTITYRLSADSGTTWKYWSGSAWATSASTSQANAASVIDTNIDTFTVSTGGIMWQAILSGDGTEQVTLNSVTIGSIDDNTAPQNPSSVTALSASAGVSITTDTWYTHTAPYFSWSGASDTSGSGVEGYYVYFGTNATADPAIAGVFQVGSTYTASSLTNSSIYYLRIKTRDNAQNISATAWQGFIYKYDSASPTNPSSISVDPAGYAPTNSFTFSWAAGSDAGAGIAGYQYKTGTASGSLADWSSTTTSTSVEIPNAAYQTDANVFYLRTIDNAANVSSSTQVNFYYAGDGPTAPNNLSVNPATNTSNSFAFSWQAPDTYSGEASDLTYCYTVNTLPSSSTCTYTSAGATSLAAGAFATQTGLNIFYVSAKNADAVGGAINYGSYASVGFTANTSAPGIPLNADIADVSVKSTESWKLALSWEAPASVGSGVANYQIYRSTDDVAYTRVATTTGIAYVDTGLEQETYYYKVRACDTVNNCGEYTTAVSTYPDGKYTDAPALHSGPTVSGITTKKAVISWTTDRNSDSKIQFGTSSGSYFSTEPSNSTQTTDHSITLTNLTPGITYYYKAKWTDEDGNTGTSTEKSFSTLSAPFVSSIKFKNVSINSAYVDFTVKDATKVNIQYGQSTAYGGSEVVATSKSEATYTVQLTNLTDNTLYHLRMVAEDDEGNTYSGDDYTFETMPVPKITALKVQQVSGQPTATLRLVWTSNTLVSSIVSYYPLSNPTLAKDSISLSLKQTHEVILRDLLDDNEYTIVVRGKDGAGNEAVYPVQQVKTATDFRAPLIENLSVESTIVGVGDEARAQILISWDTDEEATTQVEYGEGTGTAYTNTTQEDLNRTTNHSVTIPGLLPSKIYHLRVVSKDKAANKGESIDTVIITPKSTKDALNLVVDNLSKTFGFLNGFNFK